MTRLRDLILVNLKKKITVLRHCNPSGLSFLDFYVYMCRLHWISQYSNPKDNLYDLNPFQEWSIEEVSDLGL